MRARAADPLSAAHSARAPLRVAHLPSVRDSNMCGWAGRHAARAQPTTIGLLRARPLQSMGGEAMMQNPWKAPTSTMWNDRTCWSQPADAPRDLGGRPANRRRCGHRAGTRSSRSISRLL